MIQESKEVVQREIMFRRSRRNKQVSISLYKIIFLLYFELCKAIFFFVGQRSSENK